MNKYFNTDENALGIEAMNTLRIIETDGFQIAKGGYINNRGKLSQHVIVAYCETREEAERIIKILCEL